MPKPPFVYKGIVLKDGSHTDPSILALGLKVMKALHKRSPEAEKILIDWGEVFADPGNKQFIPLRGIFPLTLEGTQKYKAAKATLEAQGFRPEDINPISTRGGEPRLAICLQIANNLRLYREKGLTGFRQMETLITTKGKGGRG